jgi:multidrug resistance efflux pump
MGKAKKTIFFGLAILFLSAVGSALVPSIVSIWSRKPFAASTAMGSEGENDSVDEKAGAVVVKTIHPRRDASFVLSCREIADVEPYFKTLILSEVAGRVKFIQKDIGDPITEGETLIELDVPDLIAEIALKEATVEQRRQEENLARKKIGIAEAAVAVAESNTELKDALVEEARPTMEFRWKRWNRYKGMAKLQGVDELQVEEEERQYGAARAAYLGAQVAVKKAKADWQEAKANLEAAIADVTLKQALVEVARRDRDRAQAQAEFARIRAPFDGEIIRRDVYPGSFVQSSATARTEPLLVVARTDIVTVSMKVPDSFAPLVSKNIEADIQMDELPGEIIKGKVTRYSRAVASKDRTMRVEVDLFNGSKEQYQLFKRQGLATFLAPFGQTQVAGALTLTNAGRSRWGQNRKSMDAFPLFPRIEGETPAVGAHHLLPGTTGYMELRLPSDNAYLLPVGAIYSPGGKRYLVEVVQGKVHVVPVVVQAEDGRLARVAKVMQRVNPKTGDREMLLQELTGKEEIVTSGQGELSEGQEVRTNPGQWPAQP